jgi:uncharacterized RDD family membrane protein YckC
MFSRPNGVLDADDYISDKINIFRGYFIMKYAGFWSRLLSIALDYILILIALVLFSASTYSFTHLKSILVIYLLFCILWWVTYLFLVTKYGGSPGKLLIGLKIIKLNGGKITFKQAFLRSSVDLSFGILACVLWVYAFSRSANLSPPDITFWKMFKYLHGFFPGWYKYIDWSNQCWVWGELIVLLLNKKKRAIHDFIAGTVVIHNKSLLTIEA